MDRCLPFTVIRQRFLNLTLFHDVIRRKIALPPISQFAHPPIFTVDEKNRDDVSRLNSQFIRSAGIIRVHGYNLLDESGKRKTMSKASVISNRNVKDREEKWINKKKKTLKPDKILLLVFWRFPSWMNIHVWGVLTEVFRYWQAPKNELHTNPNYLCLLLQFVINWFYDLGITRLKWVSCTLPIQTFLLGIGSSCNICAVGESEKVNLGRALLRCDILWWLREAIKIIR